MANTMRIKRRASGGAGAPSSLANAELAFNEVDNILYYGKGTGGAGGTATTIEAIGGSGAYLTLTGTQTVTGAKTFSSTVDLGASAVATTPTSSDNSTKVATTAFVKAQGYGTGSVTSVALSLPAFITVSGSPVTGSGTLTGTLASQTANTVFAAPNGSAGTPAFRTLVAADIPALSYLSSSGGTVSGNLTVTGDLTINGTTTNINSTNLVVEDKNIILGDTTSPTDAGADGGGITLKGTTDKTFNWVDAQDAWTSSEYIDVASAKGYKLGGTTIIYTVASAPHIAVASGSIDTLTVDTITADIGITGTLTGNATNVTGTVAVANGGTGATSTSAARTSLGLAIGTDVQAYDATLAGLAGVATAADKLIYATGSDTFTTTDLTSTARTLLDDTSTGAMRTTLGLAIGTDVQAYDGTLAGLAGVTTAADKLIYATGVDTFTTTDLTSFGRSLLDDADNSAARTTLGLGSMATQASSNVTITGGSIDGITLDGGTF